MCRAKFFLNKADKIHKNLVIENFCRKHSVIGKNKIFSKKIFVTFAAYGDIRKYSRK